MKIFFTILANVILASAIAQWTHINAPDEHYRCVDFYNENTAFLMGRIIVLKTTNAGFNWINVEIPDAETYFTDFIVIDENISFCTSEHNSNEPSRGVLSRSLDGGQTWETHLENSDKSFKKMFFLDENYGWLSAYKALIYKTTDGGETWIKHQGVPIDFIRDMFFIDQNTGWICGGQYGGIICNTTDGGLTWEIQFFDNSQENDYIDVEFINEQKGFAGGFDRSFLRTLDGGENWEYIASKNFEGVLVGLPNDYVIRDIEFVDENLGWITGGPC